MVLREQLFTLILVEVWILVALAEAPSEVVVQEVVGNVTFHKDTTLN